MFFYFFIVANLRAIAPSNQSRINLSVWPCLSSCAFYGYYFRVIQSAKSSCFHRRLLDLGYLIDLFDFRDVMVAKNVLIAFAERST